MGQNQKTVSPKYQPKQQKIYSVELRKKLVEQIETGKLTVRDVVNLYQMSRPIVYRWLKQYSSVKRTGTRMVVESESHEKKVDDLLKRIAELERTVGRKQLEIEFRDKALEYCSKELGYDVKKKLTTGR